MLLLIALPLLVGVERLCHRATDGFAMVNILPPKGDYSRFHRETALDPVITAQTFYYFDKGAQSYVFVSEDGSVVLKLFKFQHMRTPPILNKIPSMGPLKKKREKKRKILEQTFRSFCLAYDHMREETALIALHLAPTTNLQTKLTIVDKIGKRHTIDLDQTPFILQRKGERAYHALTRWIKAGETQKAKEGLRALLSLAVSRCKRGLFDKDPDFETNFGFLENVPFQLDFGRLSVSPEEKKKEVYAPEMIRITQSFEGWIAENHPLLLPTLYEVLDEITHP